MFLVRVEASKQRRVFRTFLMYTVFAEEQKVAQTLNMNRQVAHVAMSIHHHMLLCLKLACEQKRRRR